MVAEYITERGRSYDQFDIAYRYINLGPGRTLEELQSSLEEEWGSSPDIDTLQSWSELYEWEENARGYDLTWPVFPEEQVEDVLEPTAEERRRQNLEITGLMLEVVHSALYVNEPLLDPYGNPVLDCHGQIMTEERAVPWENLTPQAIRCICMLFKHASDSDRLEFHNTPQT